MKKINEGFKPFFPIVFGTLLLFTYLNFLQGDGGTLALGIISLIFAIYYIGVGVLLIIAKEKLAKHEKLLNTIGIVLYPVFLFVYYLVIIIQGGDFIEVVGWILAITMLVATLGTAIFVLVANFSKNDALKKVAQLCGSLLAVMILVTLLFNEQGDVIAIGQIVPVVVALKCIYCMMLYGELGQLK